MSEDSLDKKLVAFGISLAPAEARRKSAGLIDTLRTARSNEQTILYNASYRESRKPSFADFEKRVKEIGAYNRRIARSVLFDADSRVGSWSTRLSARFRRFIASSMGRAYDDAATLIKNQATLVSSITHDLDLCAEGLQARVDNLELQYDQTLHMLMRKNEESVAYQERINEANNLLALTSEATEEATDPRKKTEYVYASRKLRRKIMSELATVERNQKAVILLQKELPLLDGLSSVAEAYVHALRDTSQESRLLGYHLHNVMGLYAELGGTHGILEGLHDEIRNVRACSSSMAHALENGATNMVERAKETSFFNVGEVSLGRILTHIEDSRAGSFVEMEESIRRYSRVS